MNRMRSASSWVMSLAIVNVVCWIWIKGGLGCGIYIMELGGRFSYYSTTLLLLIIMWKILEKRWE
jgi:hypothetical protein